MATRTISPLGGNWNAATAWVEAAVPTAADDVVATASSGNLTVNVASACRSMDLNGWTQTLTMDANLSIGTSTPGPGNVALRLAAGLPVEGIGTIRLTSTNGAVQTVHPQGAEFANLTINGAGSSYRLVGPLALTEGLTLTVGDFDADGWTVTALFVEAAGAGARTVTLGSGLWTIAGEGYWDFGGVENMTLVAAGRTILFTGGDGFNLGFNGGGLTYGTVLFAGAADQVVNLDGDNTFERLGRQGTAALNVLFGQSSTQTLLGGAGSFFSGSAGDPITLHSNGGSQGWHLVKSSGDVVCDYLRLERSDAGGGARWFAGAHSLDLGNNNGWRFPSVYRGSGSQYGKHRRRI